MASQDIVLPQEITDYIRECGGFTALLLWTKLNRYYRDQVPEFIRKIRGISKARLCTYKEIYQGRKGLTVVRKFLSQEPFKYEYITISCGVHLKYENGSVKRLWESIPKDPISVSYFIKFCTNCLAAFKNRICSSQLDFSFEKYAVMCISPSNYWLALSFQPKTLEMNVDVSKSVVVSRLLINIIRTSAILRVMDYTQFTKESVDRTIAKYHNSGTIGTIAKWCYNYHKPRLHTMISEQELIQNVGRYGFGDEYGINEGAFTFICTSECGVLGENFAMAITCELMGWKWC